ncbi:sensor histidine kinase [Streptomyces sp. NPDC001984]|uniref:sensor histidine kinase n=1 Tax=Streptomyces sp. NPDC002619 TaxID=3364655 RepID=UPI0036785B2D
MRISSRGVDTALTAVLVLWSLPDVPWWWRPPGHGASTPVVVGYLVVALAQSVPFLWRRRIPLAVLSVTAGAYLLRGALVQHQAAAGAAVLVAAYGVGAHGTHRRVPQTLGALSMAAAFGIGVFDNYHRNTGVPWALLGAAFLLGDAATARRQAAAAATEAAHLGERARIARELHDVLAHQLSAITVQAGAARLAPPADPTRVLAAVEQLGREALTELSHLLGALRQDRTAAPDRRPAPTLAALNDLINGTRAAGARVAFEVDGTAPESLTPGLELSVYRIAQEALTNAARHAPSAPVRITLGYRADHLELTVVNGPPLSPRPVATGGNRGLLGIRERVALYGGRLDAAPTPDGGFALSTCLPYANEPTR